ncbi:MAG TPA: bifunctional transaldolase/phosoglucose isomerase [Candidatus Dormibacteraeota bacterium]|jgi:transaldolase/glucose-6-phosphate isomerase
MAANGSPIKQVQKEGQSLWLDNIRRQLITSGELARLRDEGVTGVTSNPTIFEKAVSGSTDYDEGMVRLVRKGRRPDEMLWDLMVEDIQAAADVFRPVYEKTRGADGFVSIEVSPVVARSTKKTIAFAQELHDRCGRPNVMVKIPATKPGLPAIREMLGRGVNINVTLIFSVERYAEVVDAFMAGLEDLKRAGGDVSKIASVASFFVSRVDSKVDPLLEAKPGGEKLMGHIAIDNSKVAYERFKELHSTARWMALKKAGARPQRCLWASTSTKNPKYADTYYVEELIGPETVDTVPPATLAAFREHGEVRRSLDQHLDASRRRLQQLEELGISLEKVTEELEVEGVDLFAKSFESLVKALKDQSRAIKAGKGPRQWHSLGTLQPKLDEAVAKLEKEEVPRRLWAKDATLWTKDAAAGKEIVERLGWLNVAEKMEGDLPRLRAVAREARSYSDVVQLGMGGSSLCPDVLRHTFGRVRGHPTLHVLDTTDPGTILSLRSRIDPADTLFIVASKSGSTLETLSHYAYFRDSVVKAGVKQPGRNFAAITDPGSGLQKLAKEQGFRWIFPNPPDIGGRYSALSYFGLVPGAVAGIDVGELLERATEMAHSCDASVPVDKNPGVWLGAVFGTLAGLGRDKLTLIVTPKVRTFGYWLEQLIAESTGKQGTGIVPVEGEPVGKPGVYGDDRLFVHLRMDSDPEDARVRALEKAGQPVVTLTLRDKLDLGGEFLRWEIATAIAGSLLGIDAFDQPNVQESKDNTKKVLSAWQKSGRPPAAETVSAVAGGKAVAALLRKAKKHAYVAFMSYTAMTPGSERAAGRLREAVREKTKFATTWGYGPRFLHSTGQLHKGGPKTGVFVQIVQEDARDAAIPGQPFSFSTLKQAQALGDFQSLTSRGYPVARITLGRKPAEGWKQLTDSVAAALRG